MAQKHYSLLGISIFMLFLFFLQESAFSQETKKPKVGLVLSGGGARGYAHIGVIKVLEEQGIDVDVIGGTSMGAIVGGLYAMGYTIEEIEKIATSQDWDKVLNDYRERRSLEFYEKYADEMHILTLAIKNKKVSIPPGLVYGQNVTKLLTKLTIPAFQTFEFKDLNKPFLCMATDLLSGQAIKLDTGNLALAIRASMSVPSAFVPLKYGPYYLVDGGLMNNFPAKEVKKLGADVLIGIDIQTPLFEQDEIKNLVQVLSQSIFLNAEEVFKENMAEIDLLIKPNIDPFTAMDFNRADSLILRGEKKAREMIPQIKAFMDSFGIVPVEVRKDFNAFPDLDEIYIDEVIIVGNEKVTERFLLNSLDIEAGGQISITNLNKRIDYLYGTKLFHTINYDLNYTSDGKTTIIINIEESSLFEISVGAHYNDYAKAGLLLNLTGRNFGVPNGRLSVDLALGKVNRFTTEYVVDNGLKLGFGGSINLFNQVGFLYNDVGKRILSYGISVMSNKGYTLLTYKNISRFRLGYEIESDRIKQDVSFVNFDKLENYSGNLFADFTVDTYDRRYFPNHGFLVDISASYGGGEATKVDTLSGIFDYVHNNFSYSAFTFFGNIVVPWGDHFAIIPGFYGRKVFGNGLPVSKTSSFGGFSQTYMPTYRPFPGYEFMELSGHTVIYPQIQIRHRFWKNNYLSLKTRMLSLDLVLDDQLIENDFYYGWELSYTYYSLIGPISFSMAEAYPKKVLVFDFSLGFWF